MKKFLKFLIISTIGLVVIAGLFGSAEEDAAEETKASVIKTEENREVTDQEQAERKREEAKEEAKQKAEAEAKQKAEEEAEAKAEAEAQAKAEAEKQRKEEKAKERAEQVAAGKASVEEIQLQIMRENMSTYVDIQFDSADKIYTMTPIDQGLIDEITLLSAGIGHENWGVLVDGMTEVSESLEGVLGEGYSVAITNPLNHENYLLWIIDGVVIYNVIDDL